MATSSAAEPVDEAALPPLYERMDGLEVNAAATDAAWTAVHESLVALRNTLEALCAHAYADGAGVSGNDATAVATQSRALYESLAVNYERHRGTLELLMAGVTEERENAAVFFAACVAVLARRPPDMPLLAPTADGSVPVDTRNPTLGAAASYPRDDAPHGHLLQVSIL